MWRLLGLEPGMAVLDLACGHGSLANAPAARGVRMTGLDSSAVFLERARADAASMRVEVEDGEPLTARHHRMVVVAQR